MPDTPNGTEKKLFDVSLDGGETKTYSIPASYGYGMIVLHGGNYHIADASANVHDADVIVDHSASTVTIKNESFGTGYEWSGGTFTYTTSLNTTAYFVPYTAAHTETRKFILKELLQLVVDNHISVN